MHVFLLDIPRLEFAALIPKGDYVTLAMLGEEIDDDLVRRFLDSPEVREAFPVDSIPSVCMCGPVINVKAPNVLSANGLFSSETREQRVCTRTGLVLPTGRQERPPRRRLFTESLSRTSNAPTHHQQDTNTRQQPPHRLVSLSPVTPMGCLRLWWVGLVAVT